MTVGLENKASNLSFGWTLASGGALGIVTGTVLAMVDAVVSFWSSGLSLLNLEFVTVAAESYAVLAPVCFVAGLVCSLFVIAESRIADTAFRRAARLLILLGWAAVLFGYGSIWVTVFEGVSHLAWALICLPASFFVYRTIRLLSVRSDQPRTRKREVSVGISGLLVWSGSLAWFLAMGSPYEFPTRLPQSTASRPNVVLIVLDTVRADHLSCYGYHRKTTPNIDRFAATARVYRNCLSPSCWTLPSHASFFTGLPESAHGLDWSHLELDDGFDTLAEQLSAAGYQTVGFSSNDILSSERGFGQGFDLWWNCCDFSARRRTLSEALVGSRFGRQDHSKAAAMQSRLAEWFRFRYQPNKPFFLFLNYIEAHHPYVPPAHLLEWASEETQKRWRTGDQSGMLARYMMEGIDVLSRTDLSELETLYDEEIAHVDRKIGELLAFLESNGLFENTLFIITADHGEHFGEHHLTLHFYSLYEPLVRVPLILRYNTRVAAGVDDSLVQSHDVYPTILEVAGIDWERTDAHNCESLLDGKRDKRRVAIAEQVVPNLFRIRRFRSKQPQADYSRFEQRLRAVQVGSLKLIRGSKTGVELYDLSVDSGENQNLEQVRGDERSAMEHALNAWSGSFEHYKPRPDAAGETPSLSPREIKTLRGLGYI